MWSKQTSLRCEQTSKLTSYWPVPTSVFLVVLDHSALPPEMVLRFRFRWWRRSFCRANICRSCSNIVKYRADLKTNSNLGTSVVPSRSCSSNRALAAISDGRCNKPITSLVFSHSMSLVSLPALSALSALSVMCLSVSSIATAVDTEDSEQEPQGHFIRWIDGLTKGKLESRAI